MPVPVNVVRWLVAMGMALSCACASIPLTTAMRLSSLDEKTLVQLEPADVRVRLAVPRGNEVDVQRARLKLEIQPEDASAMVADMPLRLLGVRNAQRSAGMFRADVPVLTYELALAPEGAHSLRALQRNVMAMKSSKARIGFSVNTPFSRVTPGMREMQFWVDLKLRAGDDYLPLIDGAKVPFKDE